MQPIEPNATKLCGISESTKIWQRSLTVGGGERFPSKMHFILLLNREERKIRQLRWSPAVFRPKLMINFKRKKNKKLL